MAPSDAAPAVIFDTTVRDGLTGRGAPPALVHELIELLDSTGVDVIEVGIVNERDAAGPVAEASRRVRRALPCVLAHPTERAIEIAAEALAHLERARIHVFNPVTGASADARGLDAIESTVRHARRHRDDVQWSALDGSAAAHDHLLEAVRRAARAGATTISVPDTRGHALPHETSAIMRELRALAELPESTVLATHCHDDLRLGVANSLAALHGGARQVECTVGGIGPQGGNTPLEPLVAALASRGEALGLRCAVEPARLAAVRDRLTSAGLLQQAVDLPAPRAG